MSLPRIVILVLIGLMAAFTKFLPLLFLVISVLGLVALGKYAPNSRIVEFLWDWRGPFPHENECQSSFLFRLSKIGGLVSIVGTLAIMSFLHFWPELNRFEHHPMVMGVFLFGLPIVVGMGVLGSILCAGKACWLRITNRDKYFVSTDIDA